MSEMSGKMDEFRASKARAYNVITHQTDGPVTRFVIITRAVDAARVGLFRADSVGDPLAEALFAALGYSDDDEAEAGEVE